MLRAGYLLNFGALNMRENEIEKPQKLLQRIAVIVLGWIFILGGMLRAVSSHCAGRRPSICRRSHAEPEEQFLHRVVEKCRARLVFVERALAYSLELKSSGIFVGRLPAISDRSSNFARHTRLGPGQKLEVNNAATIY